MRPDQRWLEFDRAQLFVLRELRTANIALTDPDQGLWPVIACQHEVVGPECVYWDFALWCGNQRARCETNHACIFKGKEGPVSRSARELDAFVIGRAVGIKLGIVGIVDQLAV